MTRRAFLGTLIAMGLFPKAMARGKKMEKEKANYEKKEKRVDEIIEDRVILPKPKLDSETSIEMAIKARRSRRDYKKLHITIKELSQLLWAASGITGELWNIKLRTAPSAGALYPLEVYAVLPSGVYRYEPFTHSIERIKEKDKRKELEKACLSQECVGNASIDIVITAVYERCMRKYGQRGERYSIIEVGCVAENIHLQAESLKIATVAIGAFYDEDVAQIMGLPKDHRPLLVMPIGYSG